jgi:hypothetical protein
MGSRFSVVDEGSGRWVCSQIFKVGISASLFRRPHFKVSGADFRANKPTINSSYRSSYPTAGFGMYSVLSKLRRGIMVRTLRNASRMHVEKISRAASQPAG